MSTSSRRLSQNAKTSKNSHTPGIKKGANCVRPKDHGVAISGNPYKGGGIKGAKLNTYERIWNRYKAANA